MSSVGLDSATWHGAPLTYLLVFRCKLQAVNDKRLAVFVERKISRNVDNRNWCSITSRLLFQGIASPRVGGFLFFFFLK